MPLFSFLGFGAAFPYDEAIQEYGLQQLAEVMAIVVISKFSSDPGERSGQVRQFLREDADGMSQGDAYARQFARRLFDDESEYIGAMREHPKFPVDYAGGPQETLLQISMDFMRATGGQSAMAARFKCAIVGHIH